MTYRNVSRPAAAVCVALLCVLGTRTAFAKRRAKAKPPPPAAAEPAPGAAAGVDKQALEGYLKSRRASIQAAHKARMDFMASEIEAWNGFWNKVKDDRNLFEVRVARMRLDHFESLTSLDPSSHAATLADFERLQSNVVGAFELQQKTRLREFFAQREARWKECALLREKERADFAAEAEASWQAQKAVILGGGR